MRRNCIKLYHNGINRINQTFVSIRCNILLDSWHVVRCLPNEGERHNGQSSRQVLVESGKSAHAKCIRTLHKVHLHFYFIRSCFCLCFVSVDRSRASLHSWRQWRSQLAELCFAAAPTVTLVCEQHFNCISFTFIFLCAYLLIHDCTCTCTCRFAVSSSRPCSSHVRVREGDTRWRSLRARVRFRGATFASHVARGGRQAGTTFSRWRLVCWCEGRNRSGSTSEWIHWNTKYHPTLGLKVNVLFLQQLTAALYPAGAIVSVK